MTQGTKTLLRRLLAAGAVLLGALLLWLSPEQLVGALTMVAGLALEALGIKLERA